MIHFETIQQILVTILPHYLPWPAGEESYKVNGTIDLTLAIFTEASVNLVPVAEIQDIVEKLVADINLLLWGALAKAVAWMEIVHSSHHAHLFKCQLLYLSLITY